MTVQFRLNKMLAALVQVVLLGIYLDHYYSKSGGLGRAAFLDYQSARFDRYMGPDHSLFIPVVGALLSVTFAVALYEGLSAMFEKIFLPSKP